MSKKEKIVTAGDILDRLLIVKKIGMTELHFKTGISMNQLSIIRYNKHNYARGLTLNTIRELSKALDVPPSLFKKAPYSIREEEEE